MAQGATKVVVGTLLPSNGLKKLQDFCAETSCDIWVWPDEAKIPRDKLLEQASGAHYLLISLRETVDSELLDAAGPQLRGISTFSVVR